MNLPTHILIDAAKALCSTRGVPFMVRQSGDPDRGTMLVCLNSLAGTARLYRQERDVNFELGWRAYPARGVMDDRQAESELCIALRNDPDQWIIEIEDKEMHFPFEGPVFQDPVF